MNGSQKIDFVITWVDGGDAQWRRQRAEHLNPEIPPERIDVSEVRFRDWDNLRYWFRAVEKYAPWVNRIHFVTCGHLPAWLNTNAPKLNIVKHSDYMPAEYLPTFSSHPIEFNVHRIKGLSEQFVLFNDDFFITAPVKPEDFFVGGLPCDMIREDPIAFTKHELYNQIRLNDLIFVNTHFNRWEARKQLLSKWFSLRAPEDMLRNLVASFMKHRSFFGIASHHLPQAYLKSSFEQFWSLEPELLHETCMHKFRDARDISHHSIKFWQLLNGIFYPYNKYRFGTILNVCQTSRIRDVLLNQRYKAVCINDSDEVDFESAKKMINEAFEQVLPEKCSFEL